MIRRPYFVRPDNKGFTLVEILVAMAVLAIVTIPLLSYFSDASKLNALSSKRHKANLAAQTVMEDFKNRELKAIAEEYQGFSGTSGQYTDGTYSSKVVPTSPFVFTPNGKDDPYYFQLSNYSCGGSKYDVRIKVDEGIYKNNRSPSGGGIIYNNEFLDYNITDVEGNKNAVIVENSNDSQGVANMLYNLYLNQGNTDPGGTVYSLINANLKKVIKLSVNTESGTKIKVVCSFQYSCPVIPAIASETRQIDKYDAVFDSLDAIYIFYRPLYNSMQNEEIKIESDIPGAEKLSSLFDFYIIAKDAELYNTYMLYETSSPLKLVQDGDGNFGETNKSLKNNVTVQGESYKVPPIGSTLRTVDASYYNRRTEREQRLFEIEVSVYTAGHAGEADNLIFTLNSVEDD